MVVKRVKGLSRVVKDIEKKLKGAKIDKAAQSHMSKIIIEDVKQTIREGKNPNKHGNSKIKRIKQSTIKRRKELAKKNKTHSDYSASKSNLTLTGELIDSLTCKFKRLKSGIGFILSAKGVHKRYVGTKGKRVGKRVKNIEIIKAQAAMGRRVLGIRRKTRDRLVKILKELYQDVL